MIANVQHWTELIAKRLSGNIRADESRMLDAWLSRDPEHLEYFQQLAQIWKLTGSVPGVHVPETDWTNLEHRVQTGNSIVHMPHIELPDMKQYRLPLRRIAVAAAVILVLVVTGTFLFNRQSAHSQVFVEALDPAPKEVLLPDGSIVILRQGSKLEYIAEFKVRDVTLVGEAFFDVTKDETHPFTVVAGPGTVRVLGTKFNIKAQPGAPVELYVDEGRVAFALSTRKFDAKIFSEGQAGLLTNGQNPEIERTAAPGINATSWISGKLVFDHATLDQVVKDISRHFAVPVQADASLYSCELKADFDNATLVDVFETLRFSLNLQIEKSGERYIVSGQPCATEKSQ